ncbi:hypothetical protein IG631_23210 [Alternaria alternata]|nr:hypothetical protein IG631_23210 [Alternaria alternata]
MAMACLPENSMFGRVHVEPNIRHIPATLHCDHGFRKHLQWARTARSATARSDSAATTVIALHYRPRLLADASL